MRKSDDKACRQPEENEPPSQLTAIFIHFPVGITRKRTPIHLCVVRWPANRYF